MSEGGGNEEQISSSSQTVPQGSPSQSGGRDPASCPGSTRSPNASAQRCPGNISFRTGRIPDSLNSEFLYYSSVLKIIAPSLSSELDRRKIIPWVKKLFRPEYHSSQFREKRNKFLLCLTITLLNDEAFGIFRQDPPDGALPDMDQVQPTQLSAAEWELDVSWDEVLNNLPDNFQMLRCSVHSTREECEDDHDLDEILDEEFKFLLYLSKPYATLIRGRFERTKVATWLQALCSIKDICSSMKGIRNDYMMCLLGNIHSLRLSGPFQDYPPWRTLTPLAEAAKIAAENRPFTDPSSPDANEFLSTQPVPEEGAFCFISITGDVVAASTG